MPQNISIKKVFASKIEDLSVMIFLNIFFAFTGLRTQINLLTDGYLWQLVGIVILLAVAGKLGGCMLISKAIGYTWKDALSIGVLMNTRGLMELIVLNIGYDLGILSPKIFAIMVLMALFTTFMTGHLLNLIESFFSKQVNKNIT